MRPSLPIRSALVRRARRLRPAAFGLACLVVAAVGCGRKPVEPAPRVPAGKVTLDTVPSPARPATLTPPGGPTPWQDLLPEDARWPALVPVDVLVLADAPVLDPTAGSAVLASVTTAWRALPGVAHVYTRALDGQLRAVVRFSPGTPPARARDAVQQAWQAQSPQSVASPRIQAIGRSARTRLAISVLAPGGRQEATAQIAAHGASVLQAVEGVTRLAVAGAVRPFLQVEALAPELQANHLALTDLAQALRMPLAPVAAPDPVRALRDALSEVKLGAKPLTKLAKLVSFAPGIGEPVREARNGHLPVSAILLDAAPQQTDGALVTASSAWRRAAQRAQEFPGTDLHPQFIGNAYRYALSARDTPEAIADLSQRLQAVRLVPDVVSVFATQGTDGIPETLDVAGSGGRIWTVWVGASAPQMEVVLGAVHDRLASGADGKPGPWLVHPLATDWDTALGWLLDTQASGALLASAPDPSQLGPAIGAVSGVIQRSPAVWQVRSGPSRHAPGPTWARLQLAKARTVPADAVALAQSLTQGPLWLGDQAGVAIWLALPGGVRQAQQANVPVASLPGQAPGVIGPQVTLGELTQLPTTEPVLDRVDIDGRPALWLAADVRSDPADGFASSFWDAVERTVDPSGGLRVEPLLTGAKALGAEAAR